MNTCRFCVAIALLLAFFDNHPLLSAQTISSPKPGTTLNYADEAAVIERDEVLYRYSADGTGSRTETTAVRVQSGAALQNFSVLSFPYASGTQGLDIVYARVRKPDGKMVETPTSDAQDQPAPVTQLAPMYSDIHTKQLPVRSLAVGDTIEFEVKLTIKQPEVPDEFWGAENFGVGAIYLERRVELRVPKMKAVTVYSPQFPPDVSESGNERVYRWKGAQLRRSKAKEEEDVSQDKTPPIAWTTFTSWKAVGEWYQQLIVGRDAVTPAIQAKADEVTAGAKTDTEKVRALYEYVSLHNHYIGVDFGIGRLQPHPAAEVLADQYGDCKDKHTLLAALLRAKGFQPSAVLIGSGLEMDEKVPMPGAFNHVITTVQVEGAQIWLDTTTEVAPYRVLLPMLRDKQALVVPGKSGPGEPHLAKSPADLPFPAVDRYEGNFELAKDGTTKGNATVTMRGDDEVVMRYTSRQVARAQWDLIGQSYVTNSGFNGKANEVVLDAADDLAAPWRMRYGYTQDAWSQWTNYQTGSLLPNVILPVVDEKDPPKKEIDFGGRHIQTAKSSVRLPSGYGVELPNAIHIKSPFATFDQTYRLQDGSLVSEFTLEVLKDKVDATEWKAVKKFADDIGVQPWIQLTTTDQSVTGKGPPLAGENNPTAAQLVREVHDAIMTKDFTLALKKSDQALALNDKQGYLWSERGFIALQQQKLSEAADDYERELRQHPEETDQYHALIQLEGLLDRPAAEHQYLLAFAKAAPNDAKAIVFAGSQLLATDHLEDAVKVYQDGAKALPENKMIQVKLGSALLRMGKNEEAASLLEQALDGSSDADVLNDGAYALAANHLKLPLAEKSALKALDILESESAGITLESVNASSFQKTHLLLAVWDTLGWVYFAEDKDALAEEYVNASWRSGAHAEVGLHLGQILEKKGNAAAAMRVYEMALTAASRRNKVVAADLHARIDAEKKKGVVVQEEHPERILQEQRTFHVPRPAGVSGSGVFFAQISAAKTEKVIMTSGDDRVRGLTDTLGRLDLGLAIPHESHALLLRSGVLFCSADSTCEFVLTPPDSANVK